MMSRFLRSKMVKGIALTLAVAITGGVVYNTGALNITSKADEKAQENPQENSEVVSEGELPEIGEEIGTFSEDGIDYVVTSYEENGTTYAQVIDTEGETRKDIIFTNDKKEVEINQYEKVEDNDGDEEDSYVEVDSDDYDLFKMGKDLEIKHNANSHGKVNGTDATYVDAYKGDLWYSFEENGDFKFGRKERQGQPIKEGYVIPKENLSVLEQTKAEEFVKAMEKTCPSFYFFVGSFVGSYAGAVLAALTVGGIGAVIAIVGGGVAATKSFNEWKGSYEKALTLFEELKKFGIEEYKETNINCID